MSSDPSPPLVAVAGLPGTGTTTVCKLLSKRLALPHVYAGQIFRQLAQEHKMNLVQFGEYAETHPEVDRELDNRMIGVAGKRGAILEGRMCAWHVLQANADGLKVLLEAPEPVRSSRVANREGVTDIEAVLKENRAREASEAKRYQEYYSFDPTDPRHYDLVIDSSDKTPDEIVEMIVRRVMG